MNTLWRGLLVRQSQLHVNSRSVTNKLLIQERCIHSKALLPAANGLRIEKPALKPSLHRGASIFEATSISQFSSATSPSNGGSSSSSHGASEAQLEEVSEKLQRDLPKIFLCTMDFSYYHKDVILENRLRGKTSVGLFPYVKQTFFLRFWGHFRFAYVKPDILRVTKHTQDSSIKIHWRVRGITGYQTLNVRKIKLWKPSESIEKHGKVWMEGISTIYVNKDGLIVKHVIDKVLPDQRKEPNLVNKIVDKIGGTPKLAMFIQLSSDIVPHSI